jgi:hypothetical protein
VVGSLHDVRCQLGILLFAILVFHSCHKSKEAAIANGTHSALTGRKANSAYLHAAIAATIVVAPLYALYKYQQHVGWDFIPQHHVAFYKAVMAISNVVLMPGVILEIVCSPGGGHDMSLNSPLIPFGSWMLLFFLFLGCFILRQRISERLPDRS